VYGSKMSVDMTSVEKTRSLFHLLQIDLNRLQSRVGAFLLLCILSQTSPAWAYIMQSGYIAVQLLFQGGCSRLLSSSRQLLGFPLSMIG